MGKEHLKEESLNLNHMKHPTFVLALIAFFFSPTCLLSQDDKPRKFSLQFNLGLARTFHFSQPVQGLFLCFEGCRSEEQKARIAPNFNFSLYRDFNESHSLKIGYGRYNYRYWERGLSSAGGDELFPYESTLRWEFDGISIGYRHTFNSTKKVRLFIASELIYEIPIGPALIKNGVAVQPKFGAIINLTNRWSFVGEAFYKNAVTNYSDNPRGDNYVPYAYGIQLGINFRI